MVPPLDKYILRSVFKETGTLLRRSLQTVQSITDHMYVRIIDKGAGEMQGFCKWWLWGVVEEFLRTEGYIQVKQDPASVHSAIASLVSEFWWGVNSKGKMCVLYVIAKATSLLKGTWLWRPIAAYPEPVIRKRRLRLAARALTHFLQYIIEEIPNSFQFLRINDFAAWVWITESLGLTALAEFDCKEQFNKIKPAWIEPHLSEVAEYLTHKRRWRMGDVVWSVHPSCSALDRAGKGTSNNFRYSSHEELSKLIVFELTENNHC